MRHHARLLARDDDSDLNCGSGGGDRSDTGLRIASIFIVLAGSLFAALFPVLARRTKWLSKRIPAPVFDTAKYFGSGVIVSGSLPSASIFLLPTSYTLPDRSPLSHASWDASCNLATRAFHLNSFLR